MNAPGRRGRRFTTPCTIEIEHSETSLHAHLDLGPDVLLGPGDRVQVHGAPVSVRFGERLLLHRDATVERAGWAERALTRLAARFQLSELYEVSFSPGRAS